MRYFLGHNTLCDKQDLTLNTKVGEHLRAYTDPASPCCLPCVLRMLSASSPPCCVPLQKVYLHVHICKERQPGKPKTACLTLDSVTIITPCTLVGIISTRAEGGYTCKMEGWALAQDGW